MAKTSTSDLMDGGVRLDDGEFYGEPNLWGRIPLTCLVADFTTSPDPWNVAYKTDPDIFGKVIFSEDDGVAISSAGLLLGFDDVSYMSGDELEQVQDPLSETQKRLDAFSSGFGDVAAGTSRGSLITDLADE